MEIVYIGATWCGTCKTIKPAIEQLAKKFSVPLKTLDYDKDLEDSAQELIKKVPTIWMIQDGKRVAEFNMNQVASTEAWLQANVSLNAVSDDF